MKKRIKAFAIIGTVSLLVGLFAGVATGYAQEKSPSVIVFTKMSDTVVDLFSKNTQRQAYDNARSESPNAALELPAVCDASGRYTIHYWRTANETGAVYLDGCINSDVSLKVTTVLASMSMASVPPSLLVTGQSGTNYTIQLFCTGEGKRITIDNNFARCTTKYP
tara:strand:+ start:350 stop:844 length:495 start_codon:yes stop_codon:yes gene_type:complete